MPSQLSKLAERMSKDDKECFCGSGKVAKVCGCRHEKGSEVEKLSAKLKNKCQHCGVKHAFSITDAGHKLDARQYRVVADAIADMRDANEDYRKVHPLLASLSGRGALSDRGLRDHQRHMDYAARQHEQGENAYNPFGGMFTESRQELGRGGGEKKSALSQRSEPMKPAVRRDRPEAYYPQPTKVAQLREVQKLREKIAVAQAVGAIAARALPAIASWGARVAPGLMQSGARAAASPVGQFLGRQASSIAGYGALGGITAPEGQRLKGMVAGGVGGLVPGTGIKSVVGSTLASGVAGNVLGVGK